jgi:uncharacterized protein (TIGR02611 family)
VTPDPVDYSDRDLTLDAAEDRWAWRARIRAKPSVLRLYRVAVFGVGLAVVVLGLALVPLPGPGWLIVFVGVAIWASEFEKAQQLLDWGKETLSRWNAWVLRSPWWVKVGVTLGAAAAVGLVFWGLFALFAVPTWLPDPVEGWLTLLPGVR